MLDRNSKIVEKNNIKIAKKSKTSFLYSTFFLNKEKANALKAIYTFCRISDDIVDDDRISIREKKINFDNWRRKFTEALSGKSNDDFLIYLIDIVNKYKIDHNYFISLLDGMQMDLNQIRFSSFEDLYKYCYCVASTVGLIFIEIAGYKSEKTKEYAVNLGIALQLTNILRDIRKDALNGRIYIPLDDLNKFNYKENDIFSNVYGKNFIELMKYESERAKSYYDMARINLQKIDYKSMLPARIIDMTYYSILKKIEENNYDIYFNEIKLSKFKKLLIPFYAILK